MCIQNYENGCVSRYMQKGCKIYTSIYLIIFEHIFRKLIFTFALLLPNDASHLDLLNIKHILTA